MPALQHRLGAFSAGQGGKGIVSCCKRKPEIKRSGLCPKVNGLTREEIESSTKKEKKGCVQKCFQGF